MKSPPDYRPLGRARSFILPFVTTALAAAIFAADTVTASEIAVSVMYVSVILMSARFCDRRGVVLVGVGCFVLTLFSFSMTSFSIGQSRVGLVNTLISLLAVSLTTYLVLKIETAKSEAEAFTQAEQLRDALIGSVSHELRTPLASILGGVSIMAETPTVTKDPRLASLANGIRDEAVRLNADIQNLLDAARITSGLQSRKDWSEPADIINAAVERIKLRYPEHRIAVTLGQNLSLIQVDPVLIEQALGQIIANAAKFSPPRSTIYVSAEANGRELTISVRDEGVGLTAEEKGRVPERFFRGPRHVGKISGSGLGLWIANTFVMSSGGRLEADSPGEGQGTTIRVAFPISPEPDDTGVAAQEA